jgi:ABC-type transport system substrate-binding protein
MKLRSKIGRPLPTLTDAAIALLLTGLGLLNLWIGWQVYQPVTFSVAIILTIAAIIPLAFMRRFPFLVLAIITAVIVLYRQLDIPEGTFTPNLAESWAISPDTKVYEFKLRNGVKFHNGDTLTAEDVVFSFWRYKAAQAKLIHEKVEKVEGVNPHLVRIRFKEPFPDFLEYLMPGAFNMSSPLLGDRRRQAGVFIISAS